MSARPLWLGINISTVADVAGIYSSWPSTIFLTSPLGPWVKQMDLWRIYASPGKSVFSRSIYVTPGQNKLLHKKETLIVVPVVKNSVLQPIWHIVSVIPQGSHQGKDVYFVTSKSDLHSTMIIVALRSIYCHMCIEPGQKEATVYYVLSTLSRWLWTNVIRIQFKK